MEQLNTDGKSNNAMVF